MIIALKNHQLSKQCVLLLFFTCVHILIITQASCSNTLTLLQGNPEEAIINKCLSIPSTQTFVFLYSESKVKTNHITDGIKDITVSKQAFELINIPSAIGVFLIASYNGNIGVRKTNDLTYVKDIIIPGIDETPEVPAHLMELLEGTNYFYISFGILEILRLELVNLDTIVKVGQYTGTVGFKSKFSGSRRGKRLMFTSTETGRLLHTIDGTNNMVLRVDDISAHYFAVPPSY